MPTMHGLGGISNKTKNFKVPGRVPTTGQLLRKSLFSLNEMCAFELMLHCLNEGGQPEERIGRRNE